MFENCNDVMTPEEVAEVTPICAGVVRQFCREGKLKAAKAGKRWLIPKNSLIEFIESGGTEERRGA